MIIELAAVRPGDRPFVGGKALGCASLRGLGLPVPRGVVLTTRAFDSFLAPFAARRKELHRAIQHGLDDQALREQADALMAEARRAPLPADVARALDAAAG